MFPFSQGYKYETVEGQCCGKCVQVSCVMKLKDNTTKILQVQPDELMPMCINIMSITSLAPRVRLTILVRYVLFLFLTSSSVQTPENADLQNIF